jgi:hypothetical protein
MPDYGASPGLAGFGYTASSLVSGSRPLMFDAACSCFPCCCSCLYRYLCPSVAPPFAPLLAFPALPQFLSPAMPTIPFIVLLLQAKKAGNRCTSLKPEFNVRSMVNH